MLTRRIITERQTMMAPLPANSNRGKEGGKEGRREGGREGENKLEVCQECAHANEDGKRQSNIKGQKKIS